MQTQDRVKALAFGVVLTAWALVKLGPPVAEERSAATSVPLAVSVAFEARQTSTSDGALPAPAFGVSAGPGPLAGTSSPGMEGAAAPVLVPPPDAVRRELELQAQLESDALAYTRALVDGDAATIHTLLAARCRTVDAASLIDRRRASLSLDLGVPISDVTLSAPLIGHFDAVEGVAHAFLGFESGGRKLFPRTIDGWLYESGHWRNAECT